jgi:putative flippase GtrA
MGRIIKKIMDPEFVTYLVVGGLTALIYFGIMALSVEVFEFNYRVGVSVAYVLAVTFHFAANRKFTFRVVDKQIIHQSVRYFCVLLINYLITIGAVSFFVGEVGISTYLGASISIVVTVGIGYFASKFWIFRNREF